MHKLNAHLGPVPARDCDVLSKPSQQSTTQQASESKDVQKLNKTERAFYEQLCREHRWVGVQCLTLKLGDDCRYTPDLWTHGNDGFTAWEVKGFWRDDAKVKIKVAARMYPMLRFIVVTKSRDGWTQLPIQP